MAVCARRLASRRATRPHCPSENASPDCRLKRNLLSPALRPRVACSRLKPRRPDHDALPYRRRNRRSRAAGLNLGSFAMPQLWHRPPGGGGGGGILGLGRMGIFRPPFAWLLLGVPRTCSASNPAPVRQPPAFPFRTARCPGSKTRRFKNFESDRLHRTQRQGLFEDGGTL